MRDDFLKTVKSVQSTGQAPITNNQTSKEIVGKVRVITENAQINEKIYRFATDEKDADTKKK